MRRIKATKANNASSHRYTHMIPIIDRIYRQFWESQFQYTKLNVYQIFNFSLFLVT